MSEPEYFYGWRPSAPDIRDLVFTAAPAVVAALPPVLDLAVPALPAPFSPAWQQGRLGSCGPHTACADIVFAALKQQGLASVPMPSRLFVYYATRSLMNTTSSDSGVTNRELLKALAKFGWCDEDLWPYDVSKFKVQPPQAAVDQAAKRKIAQYLAVPQTLDQMLGCLAQGDPFIFGFTAYASLESPEVARTGIVPLPRRGERSPGGHDVLMVGYNAGTAAALGIPPRHFKFRNSWGHWGANGSGYGFIPFEYATNPQLAGDFWTVRHSALDPAPTPPPPPVPPTPAPGKRLIAVYPDGKIELDGRLV